MILIHLFYRFWIANSSPLCKKVVTVTPQMLLTVRLKIFVTSKSKILLTVSLKKLVTVQLKKLLPPYLNSILPLAVRQVPNQRHLFEQIGYIAVEVQVPEICRLNDTFHGCHGLRSIDTAGE